MFKTLIKNKINVLPDFSKTYLNKNIIQYKNNLEDERLLVLLKEDNAYAWHCIYDKYAALMYGNILNITRNKEKAEKIFINAFIHLKEQNSPIPPYCSIPNFLCMYAKRYANEYVGIPPLPIV